MVQSVSISATALLLAAGARACTFPPEERSNGILEFRLAGWLAGPGGGKHFPFQYAVPSMAWGDVREGGKSVMAGGVCVRYRWFACMGKGRCLIE